MENCFKYPKIAFIFHDIGCTLGWLAYRLGFKWVSKSVWRVLFQGIINFTVISQ